MMFSSGGRGAPVSGGPRSRPRGLKNKQVQTYKGKLSRFGQLFLCRKGTGKPRPLLFASQLLHSCYTVYQRTNRIPKLYTKIVLNIPRPTNLLKSLAFPCAATDTWILFRYLSLPFTTFLLHRIYTELNPLLPHIPAAFPCLPSRASGADGYRSSRRSPGYLPGILPPAWNPAPPRNKS